MSHGARDRATPSSMDDAGDPGAQCSAGQAGRFHNLARRIADLDDACNEGGISAFVNVCRHRGTQLVGEPWQSPALACPYRAWTYDNTGACCASRTRWDLPGLTVPARPAVPWPPANVTVLSGAGTRRRSAGSASYLGAVDADLNSFGVEALVAYQPRTFTVAMNWKLAIDIF